MADSLSPDPPTNQVREKRAHVEAELYRLAALVRRQRFRFSSEEDLQRGLEQVLTTSGERFEREARLSVKERVDFLVDGGGVRLGIEVKIGGSLTDVTRQLLRYAPHVDGLLLVTSRGQLDRLPFDLGGKPVRVVTLFVGLR